MKKLVFDKNFICLEEHILKLTSVNKNIINPIIMDEMIMKISHPVFPFLTDKECILYGFGTTKLHTHPNMFLLTEKFSVNKTYLQSVWTIENLKKPWANLNYFSNIQNEKKVLDEVKTIFLNNKENFVITDPLQGFSLFYDENVHGNLLIPKNDIYNLFCNLED